MNPSNAASEKAALDWLYGTQFFGMKLGLENTRKLLDALDLPSPQHRFIHVAGTNGKGSVAAMLDALLRAADWRTGLFTSPHLVHLGERVQVAGQRLSEAEIVCYLAELRPLQYIHEILL